MSCDLLKGLTIKSTEVFTDEAGKITDFLINTVCGRRFSIEAMYDNRTGVQYLTIGEET